MKKNNNKITVLYVDDEPINLYLFERVLKRKNYQVITALSGYEALGKLKEKNDIPVVVSDMRMPGMDGVEFIRQAKKQYPDKVFFILTGFDLTPEISNAMEENLIEKYMQKPFDQHEMDHSIRMALENVSNSQ
jgi:two-component system, response regulator, stage 0 sporulation protein F